MVYTEVYKTFIFQPCIYMFRIVENYKIMFLSLLRNTFETEKIGKLLDDKIEDDGDVETLFQGSTGWWDTKQKVIDHFVWKNDSLVNKQASRLKTELIKLKVEKHIAEEETKNFLEDIHKSVSSSLSSTEKLDESDVLEKLNKIDLKVQDRIEKFKIQKEKEKFQKEQDTIVNKIDWFENGSYKNKVEMQKTADQIIKSTNSFNLRLKKSKYWSQLDPIDTEKLNWLMEISNKIQEEKDAMPDRAKALRSYFLNPQLEKFEELWLLDQEKIRVTELVKVFNRDLKDLGFGVSVKIEDTGFLEKIDKRRWELEEVQKVIEKKRAEEKQKSILIAEEVLRGRGFVFIDTEVFTQSLSRWSKWDQVKVLQTFLGFENPDGDFGPETETSLMAYQKMSWSRGRNIDGVLTVCGTSRDKTLWYIKADVVKLAPKKIQKDIEKAWVGKTLENEGKEKKKDGSKDAKKEKKVYENWMKKFEEVKTEQYVAGTKGTFWWILDLEGLKENLNLDSFFEIIKKMDFHSLEKFYLESEKISDKNNLTKKGGYSYTPFNISELKVLFKEKWYDADGFFFGEEVMSLIALLESFYVTQKRIPGMVPRDRMRLLFDFDSNGKLQIDKNFYVWELQMGFHSFDSLTADNLDILFENLWLWTYESFSQEMGNNLYNSRERFQRALWVIIERGVTPSEIMIKWWVEQANGRIYEEREGVVQKISEEVDKYVESKLSELRKLEEEEWIEGITDIEWISRAIKLEAVWLLASADSVWVWASFNIEKLPAFFDSLEVWLFFKNGQLVPGIAISKKLLEKNGFTATWSQAFLVVPVFTGTYTMDRQIDDFQRLYPKKIKGKVGVSTYASGTYHVVGWGIALNRIDQDTSKGIEKMKEKMSEILEGMWKDIQEWKTFEQSKFASVSENKNGDAKLYEEMKSVYDTYAKGKPYEKEFLDDMIKGYLSYYENQLFKNAEGTKATTIWVWGAMIYWIFPILFLTAWGEHISTKWESVIHSVDRARDITRKSIDLGTLGVKEVEYKGHKVLYVPNIKNYTWISSSIWSTQAEIVDGNAYISWDLSSFSIDDYTTHEGLYRAIILWEGEKNEKTWRYESTEIVDITSSIDGSLKSEEIFQNDLDAIESTEAIRWNLFNIIQFDALNHPKTIGMLKLQKMIFNYKKSWTPALDSVWNQFNRVVTHSGFKEYAKERWTENQVDLLINSLSSVKTESEKVLITQSVASNFMKKSLLQDTDNDPAIEIANGKTIEWYDRKYGRAAYFDKQFKKKFPALLKRIQDAREEWNKTNKDATEYTFQPVADGAVVFTWVESKKRDRSINVSGIMSYTWAYNVAEIGRKKDFIEMPWKSAEVVNGLPERVLENIREVLNKNGADLKNIQQVKDFINTKQTGWLKVDYTLAFTRMWECLNDSVVIKDITIIKDGKRIKIWATTTGEVYSPSHDVVNWWLVFHWKTERRKNNSWWWNGNSSSNVDTSQPDSNEGNVNVPSDPNAPNI